MDSPSADSLTLPAPAKLNLFLRITGRRADGYHLLQTVFQLLDWGDEVRLEPREDGRIERLFPLPGISENDDLSLRAARALQDRARRENRPWSGVAVGLHKQIPQGSGLGGASTDAATVLHGLNHLWDCGFSTAELAGLALELGADVPVFVHGFSAWAQGIGEVLEPVALGERWYVLLFPGEGASTAELFADPDLCRDAAPLTRAAGGDYASLGNAFLPVLARRSVAVARAAADLARFGEPRLSGSGSTLFLEAADEMDANRLTTALKNHYNVRAVRGTDRSVLLDRLPSRTQ
jgi:4-diphosphocytidyl-2-C-methyl-D-erythritol kinase